MSENKNTIPTNKVKLIIAAILLFVFYGSFSQTNKTDATPFTLDVEGGINVPTSDFKEYANNGYQVGLMLNKGVYKNLALGVSANYNHFELKDNFESPDNAWSSISLGIGPQYTLPLNMFFIQFYGHIGMSLIKTPSITQYAQNVHESFDKKELDVFNLESNNTTGFHTDVGVKLGTQLSKRVRLFVGSSYSTSLNNPIKYNSRDLSEAIHPSGEVNMDLVNRIPFEENGLSFSSFNVNAGVSINLGKTSAARPVQDYNSSRSNKPRPIIDIIENDTVAPPAQDYNSSRSNKPSPIVRTDDEIESDSVPRPVQDYNSSRSNKPRPIIDIIENDTVAPPAQDYNSSRSNKPSPIVRTDDEIENDSVPRPLQDYNSSRSNKPRPIVWTDDKFENDSVQGLVKDYNASRRDYDAKKPKEPRSITPPEDGNRNDSVPKPVQDYNSSRSNKPRPIIDIVENDTVAPPAQDYNSSRSNKPSPIVRTDDEIESDSVPRPVQDYNSSRSNKPRPISVIDDINDINNDQDEVVVIGKLIIIDLKSRSFELVDKKKQKISGQFQPKVTNEEIKKLRRDFLNKQANIHVKIKKTKLETGKNIKSYEL